MQVLPSKLGDFGPFRKAFIDFRTLGSNTQSNADRTPAHNAILLFKDVLAEIHSDLLAFASSQEAERADVGLFGPVSSPSIDLLDKLADAITQVGSVKLDELVTDRSKGAVDSSSASSTKLTVAKPSSLEIGGNKEHKDAVEAEITLTYKRIEQQHVVFKEVHDLLSQIMDSLGLNRFFLLIDEWSAVAITSQPYLAEYLKRTVLPNSRFVVKIASLEYRSEFSVPLSRNSMLGFEVGADISATLDLDDYYVYDRNKDGVVAIFKELLFRHIEVELKRNHLPTYHRIDNFNQLVSALFTTEDAFVELVRAAEGVARDLINIFSFAFFDSLKRGRDRIDMQSVTEAAREWYERDKSNALDARQEHVLSNILRFVIGEKAARSFMVQRLEARHPLIQSLFDYRVIRLIRKGYADKTNVGIRYNIYTLDYGTYVDLLKTKQGPDMNEPAIDTVEDADDRIVPFDDKRSIRRIILTAKQIEDWAVEVK